MDKWKSSLTGESVGRIGLTGPGRSGGEHVQGSNGRSGGCGLDSLLDTSPPSPAAKLEFHSSSHCIIVENLTEVKVDNIHAL